MGTCLDCPVCLAGTYRLGCSGTSPGSCPNCTANHYCPEGNGPPVGHIVTTCAAGNFLSTVPSALTDGACTQCPAGKFKVGTSAATSCSDCSPGTFSSASGAISSATCVSCAAGTSAAAGSTECAPCTAGTSWSAARAETCTGCQDKTCTANQYKVGCTTLSDTQCLTCSTPPSNGQLTIPTDPTCPWICNTGFYKKTNVQPATVVCAPCTTTSEACATGQFREQCQGGVNDGACVACTNKPLDSVYSGPSSTGFTSNCPYDCVYPFVMHPATGFCCVQCLNGQYAAGCTKTSSGMCQPCQN